MTMILCQEMSGGQGRETLLLDCPACEFVALLCKSWLLLTSRQSMAMHVWEETMLSTWHAQHQSSKVNGCLTSAVEWHDGQAVTTGPAQCHAGYYIAPCIQQPSWEQGVRQEMRCSGIALVAMGLFLSAAICTEHLPDESTNQTALEACVHFVRSASLHCGCRKKMERQQHKAQLCSFLGQLLLPYLCPAVGLLPHRCA